MESNLGLLSEKLTWDIKSQSGHITKTVIPKAMDTVKAALVERLLELEHRSAPHTLVQPPPPVDTASVPAPVTTTRQTPPPLRTIDENDPEGIDRDPEDYDRQYDNTLGDPQYDNNLGNHDTADGNAGPLATSRMVYRESTLRRAALAPELSPSHTPPVPTPPLQGGPTVSTPTLQGGPISSPRTMDRERLAKQNSVSRFDVTALAHPRYHGDHDGHPHITPHFLQLCGYDSFTADDVLTCFNDIISAHDTIYHLWSNPTTTTYGPQVGRILQKSIKLFPTLTSTSTDDVVEFYDRLQEVTPSHLIGLVPFDAV